MYLETSQLTEYLDAEWLLAVADADRDGTPDATLLALAVAAGAAEIDARLSARYAVPIAEPGPGVLAEANAMLAAEALAARVPGLELPASLAARLREMRAILRELSEGRLALPGVAARRRIDNTQRGKKSRALRDGGIEEF